MITKNRGGGGERVEVKRQLRERIEMMKTTKTLTRAKVEIAAGRGKGVAEGGENGETITMIIIK